MKARFKRETVHDPEFLEKHHSCRLDFALLDSELAAVEPEHLGLVVEDLGEHFRLEVSLVVERVVGPVHEDRFLARVPMDVDEASDGVGLTRVAHDCRAQLLD